MPETFSIKPLGYLPFLKLLVLLSFTIIHYQQKLKIYRLKNKCIKIHWVGLIFQGVVFEFNSAPQMYLEVFLNCCKVESSLIVVGISFQAFRPE